MNIPEIFKPDNFMYYTTPESQDPLPGPERLARKAQSIFEEWLLQNGKIVYGEYAKMHLKTEIKPFYRYFGEHREHSSLTHKALLVCIELIKECEHKNYSINHEGTKAFITRSWLKCEDCGAKLKPVKFEVC